MIYYASDLHLGHNNIIRLCNRPFESVEAMNEALINNWNETVGQGDEVYIAGDLIFRSRETADVYLKRLKGVKHLILGNHDKTWINETELSVYFESVDHYAEIRDGKRNLALCHYPMMSWGDMSKGSYLVYGHIHNNKNDSYWPLLSTMRNALNASVEINGYRPVTLDELIENNRKWVGKG